MKKIGKFTAKAKVEVGKKNTKVAPRDVIGFAGIEKYGNTKLL